MSGYRPKTHKEGMSQENNRVALPIINSFLDQYDNLPAGLWPGFTTRLEDLHAVLVKNGGTERAENIVMQAAASLAHEDSVVTGVTAIEGSNGKGSKYLYIQEASIDANEYVGRELFIEGHPYTYIIIANGASEGPPAQGQPATNFVRLELNMPLLRDCPVGKDLTILKNMFVEPVVGAVSTAKTLGLTFGTIRPNVYYWLVYKGAILKDMGSIAAGAYIVKGAAGIVAALTVDQTPTADFEWDTEIIGRHRGNNILDLDIQGITAAA